MSKYDCLDAIDYKNVRLAEKLDCQRYMSMNIKIINKVIQKFMYSEGFGSLDMDKLSKFLKPLLKETAEINSKMLDVYLNEEVES